jgi:hypothetical protein
MLSTQSLQDFKDIWRQEFGEEISDDFAVEQAISLLTLMDAIYRPIKSADLIKIQHEERTT